MTHRPQPVSMMAFPGSCSKRHVSSSSSASTEIRTDDSRSWDSCSISRRRSAVLSRHQHFRLGHRLFLETFWAVLAKVSNATTAEASVCELELWLTFRSGLTVFRFCRDSFQVKSGLPLLPRLDTTPRSCCSWQNANRSDGESWKMFK